LWGANESGEHAAEAYGRENAGTPVWAAAAYEHPYDFHRWCGVPTTEGRWIPRRRPPMPPVSVGPDGVAPRAGLEVSWDEGLHWHPYTGGWRIYDGEAPGQGMAAVLLTDRNLGEVTNSKAADDDDTADMSVWEAIVRGRLRLALTCTLPGDQRVLGEAHAANVWGSHARTRTERAKAGTLRRVVVTASSRLAAAGLADPARDDRPRAADLARHMIRTYAARLVAATMELPGLTTDWLPGDLVSGIQPRGYDFRTMRSEERYPEIVQTVLLSDQGRQRTHVTLDDLRTARR
jgi:hypothetical protein